MLVRTHTNDLAATAVLRAQPDSNGRRHQTAFSLDTTGNRKSTHRPNTRAGRLLETAALHVKPAGRVVLEWHRPEWFDGLAPGVRSQGSVDNFLIELVVHDLTDGLLSATVVYRRGDEHWAQHFKARRLTHGDLVTAFHRADLQLDDYLTDDGRWVSARAAKLGG